MKYKHSSTLIRRKKNGRIITQRMNYYSDVTTFSDWWHIHDINKWVNENYNEKEFEKGLDMGMGIHAHVHIKCFLAYLLNAFKRYAKKHFPKGTEVIWCSNFKGINDYFYIIK